MPANGRRDLIRRLKVKIRVGEMRVYVARMEGVMDGSSFSCEKLKGRVMLEEIDLDGKRIMNVNEI